MPKFSDHINPTKVTVFVDKAGRVKKVPTVKGRIGEAQDLGKFKGAISVSKQNDHKTIAEVARLEMNIRFGPEVRCILGQANENEYVFFVYEPNVNTPEIQNEFNRFKGFIN